MPLVAPGVVRCTAYGTILGRPWANVWDVEADPGLDSRGDHARDVAESIARAYKSRFMQLLHSSFTLTGVRWIDLDSVNGSTGDFQGNSNTSLPANGGISSGDASPASVAVLIRKETGTGRGMRAGRCYLAGIGEGKMNGNQLISVAVTEFQTAANNFKNDVNDGAGVIDFTGTSKLVVVSAQGQVFRAKRDVTKLTVPALVATQRERLRP